MAKTITYPHAVIYDGVFYPANTPITPADVKQDEKPVETEGETVEAKPKKRGAK